MQIMENIFLCFSYDLKNNIEKLKSSNLNDIQFPQLFCFIPEEIKKTRSIKSEITDSRVIDFKAEISKKNYLENVEKLKIIFKKAAFI